jgi:hypothetical protein
MAKETPLPLGAVFLLYSLSRLHHLHVDGDTGRKIEVRKRFDNLRVWREDVDETLMDAHFELLTCVLVDERGAVHSPTLDLCGKRYRADDLRIEAIRRIHDLLHREIEDLVLVRAHADAKLRLSCNSCVGSLLRLGSGSHTSNDLGIITRRSL